MASRKVGILGAKRLNLCGCGLEVCLGFFTLQEDAAQGLLLG